jgi:hypothetical protein
MFKEENAHKSIYSIISKLLIRLFSLRFFTLFNYIILKHEIKTKRKTNNKFKLNIFFANLAFKHVVV